MKKFLSLLMAAMLVLAMTGCAKEKEEEKFKVGIVLIGDENDGYSAAHINGLKAAAEMNNVEVIYKRNGGDGSQLIADYEEQLIEEGCKVIISNSYGHQSYTLEQAKANPDLVFVAMTGDNAASSGLDNLSNGFASVYQSRYVAGVVAGMKLKELAEAGKLVEENYDEDGMVKIGYVSAFPYAECVSGFTAYFLGVRSIFPDCVMLVEYTNDWSNATLEKESAKSLISKGCVIISQHADTTGAPSAVEAAHTEEGKEVYCVGYNISMLAAAPTTALTSATTNWVYAYDYIIKAAMAGEKLKDWTAGYDEGAVAITELGSACAAGTADKVAEVEAALKAGTLHVFDVTTFTVNGKQISENSECVDSWFPLEEPAVFDGYFHESLYRSAPYFAAIIDGIK